MPPPPSGITTTTGGCCWSGPKGSGGAAAAGVVRRRRAAPEPEPEERTTISSCDCDAARATSSFLAARALLRSGCCCFGESGIRWAGRDCDVGCDWVVGDREIPLPSFATCGGVVTPARSSSSPCSGLRPLRAPTCCAPARTGASPGCLCLDVLEKGEDPIPSSSNVCVCPKNLPRRKVPELWGSPPRHTPRLAVPIVAPELCATVSIAYCLFS